MNDKQDKLLQLAREAALGLGLEVDEVELVGTGRHVKLKVIIEHPGSGVSLEDCERMSHELSAILDVEDPIKSTYTLEVSSPGLDRPLKRIETFQKCIGKLARIILKGTAVIGGRDVILGRIIAVEGETITLQTKMDTEAVKFSDIAKARLEVEI